MAKSPKAKFDLQANRIEKDLSVAYRLVMSGVPAHIAEGKTLIALYLDPGYLWRTLDLLPYLKQWVNNADEAKDVQYLHDLYDAGLAAGNNALGAIGYAANFSCRTYPHEVPDKQGAGRSLPLHFVHLGCLSAASAC